MAYSNKREKVWFNPKNEGSAWASRYTTEAADHSSAERLKLLKADKALGPDPWGRRSRPLRHSRLEFARNPETNRLEPTAAHPANVERRKMEEQGKDYAPPRYSNPHLYDDDGNFVRERYYGKEDGSPWKAPGDKGVAKATVPTPSGFGNAGLANSRKASNKHSVLGGDSSKPIYGADGQGAEVKQKATVAKKARGVVDRRKAQKKSNEGARIHN